MLHFSCKYSDADSSEDSEEDDILKKIHHVRDRLVDSSDYDTADEEENDEEATLPEVNSGDVDLLLDTADVSEPDTLPRVCDSSETLAEVPDAGNTLPEILDTSNTLPEPPDIGETLPEIDDTGQRSAETLNGEEQRRTIATLDQLNEGNNKKTSNLDVGETPKKFPLAAVEGNESATIPGCSKELREFGAELRQVAETCGTNVAVVEPKKPVVEVLIIDSDDDDDDVVYEDTIKKEIVKSSAFRSITTRSQDSQIKAEPFPQDVIEIISDDENEVEMVGEFPNNNMETNSFTRNWNRGRRHTSSGYRGTDY